MTLDQVFSIVCFFMTFVVQRCTNQRFQRGACIRSRN